MNNNNHNYIYVITILITAVATSILFGAYSTALFLGNFSREWLPLYFIASALIAAFSMLTLMPFLKSTKKQPIITVQGIALVLVILYIPLSYLPTKLVPLIYTFLIIVCSNIYNANSWNIANASFELRIFKEYTPQFLAYTSFGSIIISFISYVGIDIFDHVFVMHLAALCMLVNCYAVYKVSLIQGSKKETKASGTLRKYPLFIFLAVFLFLLNMMATMTNYQMMFRLSETFDMTQITKFMTIFYLVVNAASFFTQLLSKTIIEKLGISMLFIIAVMVLAVLIWPTVIYPHLYLVALLNAALMVMYASTVSMGRQVSLNALPKNLKNKGQIAIKAVTNNLGRIIGALILLFFAYRYEFYPYQLLSIILLFLMLYCAIKIKKYYGASLLSLIKEKRFYLPIFEGMQDYGTLKQQVSNLLTSEDESKIRVGFSLLKLIKPKKPPKELMELFKSKNAEVRMKAYRSLSHYKKLYQDDVLMQQIEKEHDPEASWFLLRLILKKYPERIIDRAKEYLHSENPVFQAVAVLSFAQYGELKDVRQAIHVLEAMADSEDNEKRLYAAKVLELTQIGNPANTLIKLINDDNYAIAKRAIRASKSLKDKNIAKVLIEQLGKPKVTYDAMQSLHDFKLDVAPLLCRCCLHTTIHSYKPNIRVLCQLNSKSTERNLSRLLKRLPLLYSVEFAKQVAIRATKMTLSKKFTKQIESYIDVVAQDLMAYTALMSAQKEPEKKYEVMLRKQLIEKKLICLLAAMVQPRSIMNILPKLASKYQSQQLSATHDIALEYLDWLIEDRGLAKKVFAVIDNKLKIDISDLSDYKFDDWLSLLITRKDSKGDKMDTVDKVFALRKSEVFSHIPAELLVSIAEECEVVEYSAREKMYDSDSHLEQVHFILSGRIALKQNGKIVRHAKEGDFFGLLSTISGEASPFEAVVEENSIQLVIMRNVFEQLMEDYPDILKEIAKYIVHIYFGVVRDSQREN